MKEKGSIVWFIAAVVLLLLGGIEVVMQLPHAITNFGFNSILFAGVFIGLLAALCVVSWREYRGTEL